MIERYFQKSKNRFWSQVSKLSLFIDVTDRVANRFVFALPNPDVPLIYREVHTNESTVL